MDLTADGYRCLQCRLFSIGGSNSPSCCMAGQFAMREDVSKIICIHETSLLEIWFDMNCLNISLLNNGFGLCPAKV